MKDTRRNFLKKTTLSLFGFTLLGAKAKATPLMIECSPATLDYYGQGPFYTSNAPLIVNNQLSTAGELGIPLKINGRITNLDCSQALPNTEIEIWHANSNGEYDNTGFNLRGKAITDINGNYEFNTIFPGKYLNGSEYRPAHIHFKLSAPNATPIVTQLYFDGDTSIPTDAAASISSGEFDASQRIISLQTDANGKKIGQWNIAIDAEPQTTSVNDLHLEKGIIYKATPNPFDGKVNIQYGVFKTDNIYKAHLSIVRR